MSLPILTEPLVDALGMIAKNCMPIEAVGLVLPMGKILELPNRSLDATRSFSFVPSDIALVLEGNNINPKTIVWEDTTLWHTHPSGGVGPSRTDMKNKLPKMNHLVITIDEAGDIIPTWY